MEAQLAAKKLDTEDKALKSLLDTFGSAFSLEEIASAFCKADQDANLAAEILSGKHTRRPSPGAAHPSNGDINSEASSKAINGNGYGQSCYTNRSGSKALNLKKNPALIGTISGVDGKNYAWRIAGANKTLDDTQPLKVEAAPLASDSKVRGRNCIWRIARSNDLQPLKVEAPPVASDSSVRVGNCVWRTAGSNDSQPLKVEATPVHSESRVRARNCIWRSAGSNDPKPLNVEPPPVASDSSVRGRNCVWRSAGSNGTPNGTKPSSVKANDFSVSVNSPKIEQSLLSMDADSGSSERYSSASNVRMNDDIENFLFGMLGRGFQLERNTIREVLGRCGYDMKKSLETLLDLTAVTLDRRNKLCELQKDNLHSNSESSVKQVQKQESFESNGSRGMRTNLIPSRHSSERNEQRKEGLTALDHAPEQSNLTLSAPFLEPNNRFRASKKVVTEPLNEIAKDFNVKTTNPLFVNVKDDAEEGIYNSLRKAVKEHRETMKAYYKSAAEAFSRGDRGRAILLLEKGQFFYNKAREADEESSTKIFETSDISVDGKMEEELSLDLQNHDAKEAMCLVKIHLRTLSGIPFQDLKLNIGNGDRDAEKRKRLIIKLLEKEAIKWTEDENSGAILIRLDEINPTSLSFVRK